MPRNTNGLWTHNNAVTIVRVYSNSKKKVKNKPKHLCTSKANIIIKYGKSWSLISTLGFKKEKGRVGHE